MLQDKELDVPSNINNANALLAYQSLEEIYNKIKKNDDDIDSLEKWIDETRIELKKRILVREKKREENELMDKYISDTFHPEVVRQYKKYREEQ